MGNGAGGGLDPQDNPRNGFKGIGKPISLRPLLSVDCGHLVGAIVALCWALGGVGNTSTCRMPHAISHNASTSNPS